MREAVLGHEEPYRQLLDEVAIALRCQIRNGLARAGRGNAETEDVVQEILIAIHIKRTTWDPTLPLKPWINAIARYKLIDCLRRQGVRQAVPIEDLAETLAAPTVESTGRSDALRLLQQLPERERNIVEGVSLQGRSIRDIAAALSLQEGTVRVALHRALKKLGSLYRQTHKEA
jgi:RNA polymerase sigma-70 factor, ECF subfamily